MILSWNGKFVSDNEVKISPYSRSFLYGENVFTTLLLRDGSIIDMQAHLKRVNKNAKTLFGKTYDLVKLERDVKKLIEKNGLKDAVIRISLFSNEEQRGLIHAKNYSLVAMILVYPFPKKAKSIFVNGISMTVSNLKESGRCLMDETKIGASYVPRIILKNKAIKDGYSETVLMSKEGFVTEATISNIFWVKNGKLFTPSKEVGLYPGITAAEVIKVARKLKLKIEIGKFTLESLNEADEIFLTGSLRGIIPVTSLQKKKISGGKAGGITSLLSEKYWEAKKIKNPYL